MILELMKILSIEHKSSLIKVPLKYLRFCPDRSEKSLNTKCTSYNQRLLTYELLKVTIAKEINLYNFFEYRLINLLS